MNLRNSIESFLKKYPYSELQDVFKLLYQIVLGPGHIISSIENVKYYLEKECANLQESSEEIFDYLSDDVIRINLYPFVMSGGSLTSLANAFFESQYYFEKDYDLLLRTITENEPFIARYPLYDEETFQECLKQLINSGFAPFSHSEEYRELYHPHYRIIHKNTLKSIE